MTEYKVEILSGAENLTGKERVKVKDFSNMVLLDDALRDNNGRIVIDIKTVVELSVHNEKTKDGNTDYIVYVIIDTDGKMYYTSSVSFYDAYTNIHDEMAQFPSEQFEYEIYHVESKNYKGKYFITCSVY